MSEREYRVIRTEELQGVWHPFFLTDVVAQARTERAARIGSDNWDTLTDAQKLNAYMGVLTTRARRFSIVIGDYSGDGHGHCERVVVEIGGEDVTDPALERSFRAAVEASGFSPYDLLCDYGDTVIPQDKWEAVQEVWQRGRRARERAALSPVDPASCLMFEHRDPVDTAQHVSHTDLGGGASSSEGWSSESVLHLVMAFVGFGVANFTWRVVPSPANLVGGWSPLLRSTNTRAIGEMLGYGVFHG